MNDLQRRDQVPIELQPPLHPSPPLGPSQEVPSRQCFVAQLVFFDADVGDKKMPEAENPVYDKDNGMADDLCLKEFQSTSIFQSAQPEDLLVAYLDFVRELPELIPSVRSRLQQQVEECLNIFQLQT